MSLLKPKEKVTVEQHAFLFLSGIYKFDPTPDFIRISRKGLLTNQELEKLKNEDHYLLTAQEIERLNWLWSKGKIENLPNTLDSEQANEQVGYWLGYALPFVYKEISGVDTAMQKTEKAWKAIEDYLGTIENAGGAKLDEVYDDLATDFVVRVLGKNMPMNDVHAEKI